MNKKMSLSMGIPLIVAALGILCAAGCGGKEDPTATAAPSAAPGAVGAPAATGKKMPEAAPKMDNAPVGLTPK